MPVTALPPVHDSQRCSKLANLPTKNQTASNEFSAIILPDFFDTAESLHSYFSFLADKYPKARLLFVYFPTQKDAIVPATASAVAAAVG